MIFIKIKVIIKKFKQVGAACTTIDIRMEWFLAMTPWEKYQQDLELADFHYDAAQETAVKELQRLYDELTQPQSKANWRSKLKAAFGKEDTQKDIKGIYFYGGVGRGKTYLVDTFFECLPFERKMRVHFHRFMHRIHDELKLLKNAQDPLKTIALKIAKEARVICFDEFFVSDITDAMILGTLMEELFGHGIVLVATSNIIPNELYKNGLQRARFLPAIDLLNQNTNVVNVDSGIDYRLRTLEQAEIYHYPLDAQATENLNNYFTQLAPEAGTQNEDIDVNHRQIPTMRNADGVLMIEFDSLCKGPRSQSDYIELSRCYHSVLLANVEQMGQGTDDVARRFIAMVDEFYERNVKLIISAQVALEELYTEGLLSFEFRRCLSRLKEMQSHEYLATEHLP